MSKNPHHGASIDELLEGDGVLEEATAQAIQSVIAWQLAEVMKEQGLTKTVMAERLRTSRSQIDRILDPDNENVSLATLRKAAEAVGRKLRVDLV